MTCCLKTEPFGIGVLRVFSLRMGGTGDNEGLKIFGRTEGVHIEAGHGGDTSIHLVELRGIAR